MEDNIRYFIGWYPEHGIFHIIFLHPYILFWEATKLCEEENLVIHSYNNTIKLDVYFSSRSSTVMKMSVWGLMTITAVMRNLSALSTSGSGLNMKFCFLNQGCRSKNIVLKPFNMINDRDDIVSLTWTYQCLGWRWPRPPLCWRSGHSSSPRSTSRWGGAGRCRGCRRASRDYPRDSWQRGTPPDPLEEDQMSVTLTITPVTPDIPRYLAWCHSDDWTPLPPWPTPAWRWAPPRCCWSPGCSPWRRNSSVSRHTEIRKRL